MTAPTSSAKEESSRRWALDALARIYSAMDADYEKAASAHGFVCQGCGDNCCRTRFYHHTLVEYFYLRKGLRALPDAERSRIETQAAQAVARMKTVGDEPPSEATMCPLNALGRCQLYAYRPMICRLHGIPHQLRRPDGRHQVGPGCGDFDRQCGAACAPILDRTTLYAALAELERELRQRLGFTDKLRMTIAQMLVEKLALPDDGGRR